MDSITVFSADIKSTQNWAADPSLVSVIITREFMVTAQTAVKSVQGNKTPFALEFESVFEYALFERTYNDDEEEVVCYKDEEYCSFVPEYLIESCRVQVTSAGWVTAVLALEDSGDKVFASLGSLEGILSMLDAKDKKLRDINFSGEKKSISDDDLCATCQLCGYNPGGMSRCSNSWPGLEDENGYVQACQVYWR